MRSFPFSFGIVIGVIGTLAFTSYSDAEVTAPDESPWNARFEVKTFVLDLEKQGLEDNTFQNGIGRDTTLIGNFLAGTLTRRFSSSLATTLGVFAAMPFGHDTEISRVNPIVRLDYRPRDDATAILGTLTVPHRDFFDAIFDDANRWVRPIEQGAQVLTDFSCYRQDLFVNWAQAFHGSQPRRFDLGYAGQLHAGPLAFNAQVHWVHNGQALLKFDRSFNTRSNLVTAFGPELALRPASLAWLPEWWREVGVRLHYLTSYDEPEEPGGRPTCNFVNGVRPCHGPIRGRGYELQVWLDLDGWRPRIGFWRGGARAHRRSRGGTRRRHDGHAHLRLQRPVRRAGPDQRPAAPGADLCGRVPLPRAAVPTEGVAQPDGRRLCRSARRLDPAVPHGAAGRSGGAAAASARSGDCGDPAPRPPASGRDLRRCNAVHPASGARFPVPRGSSGIPAGPVHQLVPGRDRDETGAVRHRLRGTPDSGHTGLGRTVLLGSRRRRAIFRKPEPAAGRVAESADCEQHSCGGWAGCVARAKPVLARYHLVPGTPGHGLLPVRRRSTGRHHTASHQWPWVLVDGGAGPGRLASLRRLLARRELRDCARRPRLRRPPLHGVWILEGFCADGTPVSPAGWARAHDPGRRRPHGVSAPQLVLGRPALAGLLEQQTARTEG